MRKITQTIVGTTPPLDKNVLWLDTTNSNEPVQKLFLNGEWRPLKDSDVDAEFATGEKVSNISVAKKEGSTSPANSQIPTVDMLTATETTVTVESGTATVPINTSTEINYIISTSPGIIDLTTVSGTGDEVNIIRFTSASNNTSIQYPNTMYWANEEPVCEANIDYVIAIWQNIGVMTKLVENSNS